MAVIIRYEGLSIWRGYISPGCSWVNEEFVETMNQKISELKKFAEENSDSDDFDEELLTRQEELEELIDDAELELGGEISHIQPEGKIFVDDEELEMDEEEMMEFYYVRKGNFYGREKRIERYQTFFSQKSSESSDEEDWYISTETSSETIMEYESDDEEFDKSKLEWDKEEEGGLIYGDADGEDVGGGDSNGEVDRIFKINIKGIEYEYEF
tara:strand:+ start:251 stop:886 length:636 start_codon:yes stop_codon:yes gene_type:complete